MPAPDYTPIHPLSAVAWLMATLNHADTGVDAYLAEMGSAVRINGRVYRRDRAPRAEQNTDAALWPFVAYNSGQQGFFNVAQRPLLQDTTFNVVFVMYWPVLPDGYSLEEYVATGQMALQQCLSGVANAGTAYGTVHGCELLNPIGPQTEGPEGFEVAEAGYQVFLRAT